MTDNTGKPAETKVEQSNLPEIDLATERLIFIAMMKAMSEQSTYLTGTLKFELKRDMKALVGQVDRFIADLEKRLNEAQITYLEGITDIYHNINLEIRVQAAASKKEFLQQENTMPAQEGQG